MLLDTGFISAPATQKASLRHEADALAEHFYFYRKPLAMHQVGGAVVAVVSASQLAMRSRPTQRPQCTLRRFLVKKFAYYGSSQRAARGGLSRDPESGEGLRL